MKRKSLSLIVMMVIFLLCGCSYAVVSLQNNTDSSLERKCVIVTDQKEKKIEVKEGKILEVSADISYEEGSLEFSIIHEDTKTESFQKVFDGSSASSEPITISLSEEGEYQIQLKANKFTGNYKISWKEMEKDENTETVSRK